MRAIVVNHAGSHGRLTLGEVPDPEPADGEVLVRVAASGVNSADRRLVTGEIVRLLGAGTAPATIPGIDAAGTIVQVGTNVSSTRVGERVVINGALTCDACDRCRAGDNGMCPNRRALGQLTDGTYAEFVALPSANAHVIADSLSFEEAAALPAVTLTAWQALVRRAKVQRADTVVIGAAASGVGSAAVQVAKYLGATVIAVASSREKVDFAIGAGADHGVVQSPTFVDEILSISDGADVVMDIAGPAAWRDWVRIARPSARIVTCTSEWGTPPDLAGFGPKQLSLLATGPFGSKPDAHTIVDLANTGVIRGLVTDVLPLEHAHRAHALLEERTVRGKLILTP